MLKKFKDLKNNVKSDELKDIVKELERAIFLDMIMKMKNYQFQD